jgi:K+-transporting ATPase KdpF subunit
MDGFSGIYLLGAAVSALLFTYLVIALLKPEWFA